MEAAITSAEHDLERAAAGVRELLLALGQNLDNESLQDTPARVARAFRQMLAARQFEGPTVPHDEKYDELVVMKDIPFTSLCEHHLLPFVGRAHVGYLPGERIIGLSKLARVVERFARRLQVQERLTAQIADWLCSELGPRGVGVVMEAEHMCMSVRGVRAPGTTTKTSALRGTLRDDARTRQEFLLLVESSGR